MGKRIEKLKTRIKENKAEIIAGTATAALGVIWLHNSKRKEIIRTGEMAKEVLGNLYIAVESMRRDIAFMANEVEEKKDEHLRMKQLAKELIDAEREFDWLPDLGMRIRPEDWTPVVKLQHLPSMSQAAKKAMEN